VAPLVTTLYCVTVSNGSCTDTACVFVYVEPIDCSFNDDQLFVPDAFSPNGDTKNDELGIYFPNLSCIKEFKLIVYDRWGEKVYESTNVTATWDGTYKGKTMNSAVFVYYMKVSFITGNEVIRKGNVSLIR
jgi:gliding motility-associated-like protein